MIHIKSLSKTYGSQKVLRDLNLDIPRGGVTGILGPNACGKTTLVKCLLGQVFPDAGEIWLDGERSDGGAFFRQKIGYMPQTPVFPDHLTLLELLNMLEKLRGAPASARDFLIGYFQLQSFLNRPLEKLSGGTKQKVAAVIAFMFEPPIVLLDEPTVGLDPLAAVAFKEFVLQKANQGATILFVSHIISEIEKLASSMAFLNEGQVLFSGTPEDLLLKTGAEQIEKALVHLFTKSGGSP
jgi:Cu-processing system ATP-binding protein